MKHKNNAKNKHSKKEHTQDHARNDHFQEEAHRPDVKEKEHKSVHGGYCGKKWYPQND